MRSVCPLALFALLLVACVGDQPEPAPSGTPRLLVSVEGAADGSLDFGRILAGDTALRSLTVQNVGDGVLRSLSVLLPEQAELTSTPAALPASLAPGVRVVLALRWSPERDSSLDEVVEILSEDPLRPAVLVPIHGEAEGPLALLEPAGRALAGGVGCEAEVELEVRHAGRAGVLRVGSVSIVDRVGGGWEIAEDAEGAALTAGQAAAVGIRWVPEDGEADAATIVVEHDGPGDPLRASLAATPQTGPEVTDRFVQGVSAPVDLVLVVDDSPGFDSAGLAEALPTLVAALDGAAGDWRVGVVSTDVATFGRLLGEPSWVESGDPDPAGALLERLPLPLGSPVPQGLHTAWQALGPVVNDGFRRPDGLLHFVFASDAEDLSEPVRGWSVGDYLFGYQAAVAAEGALLVSAITGGEFGCAGALRSAEPEVRYSEAAEATGGAMQSYCAEDWGPGLDAIGAASRHAMRRFVLSERAVPDHVHVEVDGEPSESFDFSIADNAVVFRAGAEPPFGASVAVTFATAVCAGAAE